MPKTFEANFDGLVGPTHGYSGLSFGNLASTRHRAARSNPREAVLQGLEKARRLAELGLKQGLLPPQDRPDVGTLRRLGFTGTDRQVIERAARKSPELLAACASASSMWTANAATVSPSADTADGKVHFTPANLVSKFHRSIEPPTTGAALRAIFRDPARFAHHEPLPGGNFFGDEGAANHTRLCEEYGRRGLELFVYGRYAFRAGEAEPLRFPARQTYEASAAVARAHGLDPGAVVFAQQNPRAIDAGVFHNDVVAVGNRDLLFCHGEAYLEPKRVLAELGRAYRRTTGGRLRVIEVPKRLVSLRDAVKSYLFNSQLLSLADGQMALVAPAECRENRAVSKYLDRLLEDPSHPIRQILFFDVRQSMRNGGGPACLRLRVVLTEAELARTNQKIFMTPGLHAKLETWAKKHYRDRLRPADLADYQLLLESRAALDELTGILGLGSIYPFQR